MSQLLRLRNAAAWRLRVAASVVPDRGRGEPRSHWVARSGRLLAIERQDPDPLGDGSSAAPLALVVPVGPRDVEILSHCLEGVERNLRNPVTSIVLIAPGALTATLRRIVPAGVDLVADEHLLDEATRAALLGRFPEANARWRAQQLLKLSVPQVTDAETILVVDADTVLTRPRTFRVGDRVLVLASREFHLPYYEALARLWRRPAALPRFSCVAHHMCFVRSELVSLQRQIEDLSGLDWRSAAMRASSDGVGFSEYELYGQWRLDTRPEACVVRGSHNIHMRRSELTGVAELERTIAPRVHSVSFHHHV